MSCHLWIVFWLYNRFPHCLWYIYPSFPRKHVFLNSITAVDICSFAYCSEQLNIFIVHLGILHNCFLLIWTQQCNIQCCNINVFQGVVVNFHCPEFQLLIWSYDWFFHYCCCTSLSEGVRQTPGYYIRFLIERSLSINNMKVVFLKDFGPPSLPSISLHIYSKIFEILVIQKNCCFMCSTWHIMSPFLKCINYREHFFMKYIVIKFCGW